MGSVRKLWGCVKLSQTQDVVKEDLRRLLYEDLPNNVEDIRTTLKSRTDANNNYDSTERRKNTRTNLFSDPINRELSKHRPDDIRKKRELAVFGLAFSILAIFIMLILPTPLNWIMSTSCLIPLLGPLINYGSKLSCK